MKSEGLWSAAEVAKALHIKSDAVWWAESVSIDTRSLKPGAIYVAIKGERVDGHDFVHAAFEKGAAAAIVNHDIAGVPPEKLLIVKDTELALRQLGKAARTRTKAKVIGITGSIGKTTTKEMVALMCKAFGHTYATYGNLNNHFGVPLTLANMPKKTEFAVIEMGMNHEGEIAELTLQVKPDVALITTVEAVHLEYFESVADIADAKAEIFIGLNNHGSAVLNRNNAYYKQLKKIAKRFQPATIETFGMHKDANIRLIKVSDHDEGMLIQILAHGEPLTYTMQASGDGPVYASLAALAVAYVLGLNIPQAAAAFQSFREIEGRGRVQEVTLEKKHMWWIDDSYNAGPASMAAAFKKLANFAKREARVRRTVAVLGDMLELGDTSPEFHFALVKQLEAQGIDKVFAAGPLMHHMYKALPESMCGRHTNLAEDLLDILYTSLQDGDAVLFKGSHGSKIHLIVEKLKQNI